jgi:hypothetical protein
MAEQGKNGGEKNEGQWSLVFRDMSMYANKRKKPIAQVAPAQLTLSDCWH